MTTPPFNTPKLHVYDNDLDEFEAFEQAVLSSPPFRSSTAVKTTAKGADEIKSLMANNYISPVGKTAATKSSSGGGGKNAAEVGAGAAVSNGGGSAKRSDGSTKSDENDVRK